MGSCALGLRRQITPEPPRPPRTPDDRSPRLWAEDAAFMAAYRDSLEKCLATPRAAWKRGPTPDFGLATSGNYLE